MNCSVLREFKALILAGGNGTRLSALVEDIPKALISVANKPLLVYQLDCLELVGFKNATILVRSSMEEQIQRYLSEQYTGKIQVELFCVDHLGTAQILINFREKFVSKCQFLVFSADLIVDPSVVYSMLDLHLEKDSTATFALKKVQSKRTAGDIIGLDDHCDKLLFIESSDEFTDRPIEVKLALLDKFPKIKFRRNYLDSHLYIFSRQALDILEKKKQMISLKKEFVPYLLSCQPKDPRFGNINCHVHLINNDKYCARVNTIPAYSEINKEIISGNCFYKPLEPIRGDSYVSKSINLEYGTQCIKSCVAEGTIMGGFCKIENSVIGKHCKIGNNVKIINSVITNFVIIENNCELNQTRVGNNVEINSGSKLFDVVVGAGYIMEKGSLYDHQTLSKWESD